ncbi:hypothetical protein B0T26DRAFT_780426 [Lasiosphaeria miniovina]|uniref:Uncharacterized protein n=1 Tax=Lasiosphaeria miniovina TaxID=1954250 RepID=A0AA40ABA5_9PEZI|nr:uncharacterized protein B0T26DRAFT_780426 [Lasiosphaeria miniovina]KAK0712752.1 hypothetical protein B0T26DRAFT_780426 [Lasiosphaeria miniovina]
MINDFDCLDRNHGMRQKYRHGTTAADPSLSGINPPPQGIDVVDVESPTQAEDRLRTKKEKLQAYAQQLLASDTTLEGDTKMALREFFDSSLSQDPDDRELSLSTLLRRLDPQRSRLQFETSIAAITEFGPTLLAVS